MFRQGRKWQEQPKYLAIGCRIRYDLARTIGMMADSLMEEISLFVEENCEAEILDEVHEIR